MEALNRQPTYAPELGYGKLMLVVLFGATGLPKLQVFDTDGLTYSTAPNDGGSPPTYGPVKRVTIKRVSTGLYTISFTNEEGDPDQVPRFLGIGNPSWESSTGIPTVTSVGVKASTVPVPNASSIQIQCSAPTNSSTTTLAATDPGSGEVLKLPIYFQQVGGGQG